MSDNFALPDMTEGADAFLPCAFPENMPHGKWVAPALPPHETLALANVAKAGIHADRDGPLFRSLERDGSLSGCRFNRHSALEMIARRARAAGISTPVCNYSFRSTGITAYLEHPEARVEVAQYLAGHAKTETTKLYDRREYRVSLDEIERIGI